jgi:hypothetical protein
VLVLGRPGDAGQALLLLCMVVPLQAPVGLLQMRLLEVGRRVNGRVRSSVSALHGVLRGVRGAATVDRCRRRAMRTRVQGQHRWPGRGGGRRVRGVVARGRRHERGMQCV